MTISIASSVASHF